MTEHTPLPWRVDAEDTMETTIHTIRDSDGKDIAHADRLSDEPSDTGANEANAEFIVRVCNSHYELLKACKKLVKSISEAHESTPHQMMAIDHASAAIAKAEGKQ